MNTGILSTTTATGPLRLAYHPGDWVVSKNGAPIVCEVLNVEANGVLLVRGLDWSPGYSAYIRAEEVSPVSRYGGRE